MSLSCLFWWLLLPFIALLAALLWATESRHTRIRRWHSQGLSWQAIAARQACSPPTARRLTLNEKARMAH